MTVELLDECADDVEEVIVAWLTPLRRCAAVRRQGDELPFILVHHITGTERPDQMVADEVVSVHTLTDRSLGQVVHATTAKDTHRAMLRLARHLDDIELTDGSFVNVDYVTVEETPITEFYSDQILRTVGRYRIGLTYTTQPVESGS